MTRILTCSTLTAVLLAATVIAVNAREVVEIRLRGHYFAEPATVQITVAIEPKANHRALVIEADGGENIDAALRLLGSFVGGIFGRARRRATSARP